MTQAPSAVLEPLDEKGLKPCPFCGSEPIMLKDHKRLGYYVACQACSACTVTADRARAIAAWNRRASAPEQAVKGLEEVAADLADWSNLPKDIYVVAAKSHGDIAFDVTCCSVPMITAPEVRYTRADLASAISLKENIPEPVAVFAQAILHGDDEHRADAAEAARDEALAALERHRTALNVAVDQLSHHEPGDSRAVSDLFVALAAVACGVENREDWKNIDASRAQPHPGTGESDG